MTDSTTPAPAPKTKTPWTWKDWALLGLSGIVLALASVVAGERLGGLFGRGDAASVFDVVLDHENRAFLELHFDKPLGEGKVGEALELPPATLDPSLAGVWRWREPNVLRFEPAGRLPAATVLEIDLIADRLLGPGQSLAGERRFEVRTDQFLVERVDVFEDSLPEGTAVAGRPLAGRGWVTLRGELYFNYPVDPEQLAPRLSLEDPAGGGPVAVELETSWQNETLVFRTGPLQKQKKERTLRLVVAGDLTPADGNVPLGEAWSAPIELGSSERLAVRSVQPQPGERESTLRLRLTSPVSPGSAERFVSLDPAVPFRLAADRNELLVVAEVTPGTSVTVILGAGLAAADGAVLAEDWSQQVALPDLESSLDFRGAGMFLSKRGLRTLALETVNVSSAELAVDRVYRNNVFALLQFGDFSPTGDRGWSGPPSQALGDRLVDRSLDLAPQRNRRLVTPVDVDDLVDLDRPGLYRIAATPEGEWQAARRWLLVTDLGVVAKLAGDEILVWVSSLADLEPVAGAKVRLMSDQNQVLAEGRTDLSGLWRTSGVTWDTDRTRPFFFTVERGDDWSFLPLDSSGVDTTGLDVAGAQAAASGYQAFLWGERDLYRPGETVRGALLLRDGALAAPPPMPVVLLHRDPQGRLRDQETLTTDRGGLAGIELALPVYSATGGHVLEVQVGDETIGSYDFQVEEFVPDRIKVEILPKAGGDGVPPGGEVAFDVASAYLFGAPAAGLPVEARVRLVDDTFTAEGFEAYTFRTAERTFEPRELLATEGALDDAGRAAFQAAVPPGLAPPSSLAAIVTARVSEQGGRGVTAVSRVRVHPVPYYLGLRRVGDAYAEPGKETPFEWVAVGPDGRERPAGGLRVELWQDRWNTVLRRTPEGTFRYESVRDARLLDSRAIAAGAPRGRFPLTVPAAGAYRAVLADPTTQAATEVAFYASGWGFAPWALENPARVELALERDEVRPGENAVVQVRAPFPGRLLLTVERDRIHRTEVRLLEGNTATIEVPVEGSWRPNVYLTATVVRAAGAADGGEPFRAFGAVPLGVDRTANRLTVDLVAPETMRSRRRLTARVATAPGAAVTVAAVDEGILQLVAQKTPDPFSFFYRKLALGVETFDGFALLLPEVRAGKSPAGGGDGEAGLAQYVNAQGIRRVKPVAFWSGVVTADASGEAEVSFEVPDFQGALRLMAVAADGRRFGSGERRVTVADPLIVLPSFPRFLAFGDRAEVPLTVRNDTGRPGRFEVVLAATGPVTVEGGGRATVEVPSAAEATVRIPVAVGEASGVAGLVVTVQGNGETARAEVEVPVRPDLPPRTLTEAGSLAEATAKLPADAGWARPETLRRTLRVGAVPLVQFSGRLEALLNYPYGCLEQTVAAAFPLLYLEDLAAQLQPDLFQGPEARFANPAAWVDEAIRRVATMQLYDGGFALWPGGGEAHPWGTLWATHFLVEARAAGYAVEQFVLDQALGWTERSALAKETYGADELARTAYALYVLARAGQADVGTMDFLRQKKQAELRPESRALLAAAYAAGGDAQAAERLAAEIAEVEQVTRQTGGNFDSALRNRALLLLALLEIRPEDPRVPRLVDRLAREAAAPGAWTTQESAFTLLALGRFYRRQAALPAFSGTASAGERRLGTFGKEPVAFAGLSGTAALALEVKSGFKPGAVFYSVATRGVPRPEAFRPVSAGLEVERQILTRDGRPADLGAVVQGELLVLKTRVRSVAGPVANVVVQSLLPAGLEVENARLEGAETLPWVTDADLDPAYLDVRDDRVLAFLDLPAAEWRTSYALLRAVTPGRFRLPPLAAEAMYDPSLTAVGDRGEITVRPRR